MRAEILLSLAVLALLGGCERRKPLASAGSAQASLRSAQPATAPTRTVERITGAVTAKTAAQFADLVSGQEDEIIGLKLHVEPSTDADFKASRYLADVSGEQFVISIGDGNAEGDGTEVVMPASEASYLHGVYVIDGFYAVKPGGMHQGIVSYGLEKVDPGAVLLNSAVAIQDRPLAAAHP